MYYINLQLTEKGTKVCGSATKSLEMQWDKTTISSDEDVNKFIETEFMSELVDHVISIKSDFRFLKPDDYVCIVQPATATGAMEKRILGKVVHVNDDGYGHYIMVKEERRIDYYPKDYRFNFEGFEIGGSRKYKKYIEIPTEEFIEHELKIKNIHDIYHNVIELLCHTYEWEDGTDTDYYGYRENIPIFLTPDELFNIHNILVKAKARYDDFDKAASSVKEQMNSLMNTL